MKHPAKWYTWDEESQTDEVVKIRRELESSVPTIKDFDLIFVNFKPVQDFYFVGQGFEDIVLLNCEVCEQATLVQEVLHALGLSNYAFAWVGSAQSPSVAELPGNKCDITNLYSDWHDCHFFRGDPFDPLGLQAPYQRGKHISAFSKHYLHFIDNDQLIWLGAGSTKFGERLTIYAHDQPRSAGRPMTIGIPRKDTYFQDDTAPFTGKCSFPWTFYNEIWEQCKPWMGVNLCPKGDVFDQDNQEWGVCYQASLWVEYRTAISDNVLKNPQYHPEWSVPRQVAARKHGAILHMTYSPMIASQLLDANPDSQYNLASAEGKFVDAPLTVGRTFSDPFDNVHITNLGVSSQDGLDSIELIVHRALPGQEPLPVIAAVRAGCLSPLPVDMSIEFHCVLDTTSMSGDGHAFFWDFGDPDVVPLNSNRQSYTFTTPGSKQVTCEVSNLKGGVTRRTIEVQITTARTCTFPTPTCFDSIQNGAEEGVDCGGTCQRSCDCPAMLAATNPGLACPPCSAPAPVSVTTGAVGNAARRDSGSDIKFQLRNGHPKQSLCLQAGKGSSLVVAKCDTAKTTQLFVLERATKSVRGKLGWILRSSSAGKCVTKAASLGLCDDAFTLSETPWTSLVGLREQISGRCLVLNKRAVVIGGCPPSPPDTGNKDTTQLWRVDAFFAD